MDMTSTISNMLILLISIIIHETGHAFMAKLIGYKVTEIAFGFGPNIINASIKGTIVKFKLLPIGGYCRIPNVVKEYTSRRETTPASLKKIAILFSGPFLNLLICFVSLALVTLSFNGLTIVTADKFNSMEYLKEGNVIKLIDGSPVAFNDDKHRMIEHSITVEDKIQGIKTLKVTGQTLNDLGVFIERDSIFHRMNNSYDGISNVTTGILIALNDMAFTDKNSIDDFKIIRSNLNGSFRKSLSIGAQNANGILLYFGVINLAIAIINLFPLPVFDGGRILISVLEILKGRSTNSAVIAGVLWISLAVSAIFEIYVLLP